MVSVGIQDPNIGQSFNAAKECRVHCAEFGTVVVTNTNVEEWVLGNIGGGNVERGGYGGIEYAIGDATDAEKQR